MTYGDGVSSVDISACIEASAKWMYGYCDRGKTSRKIYALE